MNKDEFAVRVQHVSKIYRLWGAPKDRLFFSIKRFLRSWWSKENKINAVSSDIGRDFYALNDVSFEIRKGESWGFVGVNGSGKSTLLKIISGNLRLSSGRVDVDGKVAILDYGNGFNGEFSGKENIYLKATLMGLTKKQINERFDSIVEFAELGDFIHQPVKTYSSGMSARLGFAIMAHVDADIIITDEALAVGDIFFVQKCMRFIRSFLKRGTFLFVSHSTNDILSLCQQAVWLEHGVIKSMGPAPKVVQSYLDKRNLDKAKNLIVGENKTVLSLINEKIEAEISLEQPFLSKRMGYKYTKAQQNLYRDGLNVSIFRNDIQIISDEFSTSTSIGGAIIKAVTLRDKCGVPLAWVVGGGTVVLRIEVLAERELQSPIVGFQVMDHLGQVLFADNSSLMFHERPVLVKAGTLFAAEFTYQMPVLPVGRYSVRVAIAIGEEGNAVLLQTINNALVFNVTTSYARYGLVGAPTQSIKVYCNEKTTDPFLLSHANKLDLAVRAN